MKNMVLGTLVLLGVGILAASSAQAHCGMCGMDAGRKTDEPVTASEPEKKVKFQTTCPVMGGEINKKLYVDHNGKRVYMCCKGCESALKKDPAKYIKQLEDEGITVAKLQTTCPVLGEKINKDLYVDHDGKRIYVCCQGCIATVQKDPAKYIKSMEEAGIALDTAGKVGEAAEPTNESAGHAGHQH